MSRGRIGWLLQENSLYVLFFLLPFSKAAVEICFGFLLVGWVLERLDPATRLRTVWLSRRLRPLVFAIAAYLTICALSIVVSDFPKLSLRAFFSKWVEYLLFFVIVADVATRPGVIIRSLSILAWSSLCVVIHAMTQEVALLTTGFYRYHPVWDYQRMTGPYTNPIDLATYLMVVTPIFLTYAVTRQSMVRWALWGIAFLLALCLVRTQAAGAWLGLCIGMAVIMGWGAMVRRHGFIFLIVLVLAGGFFLQRGGRLREVTVFSDIGTVDRWVMWQAAIGMIRDRPILGHGLNTFMANYLDYWVGGERSPRYAHNCYLQVAAETGLLGLAGFMWLLWRFFSLLRTALDPPIAGDGVLLLGLFAGLLAFAIQAGVDTNFYALRQAALFWILAGLSVGLSTNTAAVPQAVSQISPVPLALTGADG